MLSGCDLPRKNTAKRHFNIMFNASECIAFLAFIISCSGIFLSKEIQDYFFFIIIMAEGTTMTKPKKLKLKIKIIVYFSFYPKFSDMLQRLMAKILCDIFRVKH